MPFRLYNAPATFQRIMNRIFNDMIGTTVHVYIDDITVYTKTFKEHMEGLEEVLFRIKPPGMSVKPKKCTFPARALHLLGYTIGRDGIKTEPPQRSAAKDYPVPTGKTTTRAMIGATNC